MSDKGSVGHDEGGLRAAPRPPRRALFSQLRDQRAGIAAALLALLVYLTIHDSDPAAHAPGSDGHYSWVVARSLAFDLDLHYANDYALCGDPWRFGVDRGGGRPDNPFYVGPAVFWVPMLWLARVFVRLPAGSPASIVGACTGPRASFALHVAPILGAISVFLFYRIARRFVDRDGPAALSAALFGLTSSLLAYATVLPSYSHVYATFAVSCLVLASLRAHEAGPSRARWALVALSLVVCVLQRSSCIVFAAFPGTLALLALRRGERRGLARFLPAALVGAGGLAGASLLLAYYRLLYGSPWTQPQGEHFVHVGHAHPWLLLFAVQGGLFFTAPVTWLSVVGAAQLLRDHRTRALAAAALLPCVLEVYVSSLPLDWEGACTFGARRLTTLLPFCALLAVRPIEALRAYVTARPKRAGTALGVAVALPLVFSSFGAVWGLPKGRTPLCSAATQEQLYGQGAAISWSLLDQFGDVSVLPMSLLFRLRYGLPMSAWRYATRPTYIRHYRDLRWLNRDLDMHDPTLSGLGRGISVGRTGARLVRPRASLVFAAQWPFATRITLQISAKSAAHLGVGNRSWIGHTVSYGVIPVEPGVRDYTLTIPPGGFDSGLQELVFDLDHVDAAVSIGKISLDDEAPISGIRAVPKR